MLNLLRRSFFPVIRRIKLFEVIIPRIIVLMKKLLLLKIPMRKSIMIPRHSKESRWKLSESNVWSRQLETIRWSYHIVQSMNKNNRRERKNEELIMYSCCCCFPFLFIIFIHSCFSYVCVRVFRYLSLVLFHICICVIICLSSSCSCRYLILKERLIYLYFIRLDFDICVHSFIYFFSLFLYLATRTLSTCYVISFFQLGNLTKRNI